MVWKWKGGGWRGRGLIVCCQFGQHHFWSFILSFDLYIDVEKLSVVVGGCLLDYNVSSGSFLIMNFEFDQDHGPRQDPILTKLDWD